MEIWSARVAFRRIGKRRVVYAELFPNAKAAKNSVQQIVGVNGSDHLAELFQGQAEFESQEFGGFVEEDDVVGRAQMV